MYQPFVYVQESGAAIPLQVLLNWFFCVSLYWLLCSLWCPVPFYSIKMVLIANAKTLIRQCVCACACGRKVSTQYSNSKRDIFQMNSIDWQTVFCSTENMNALNEIKTVCFLLNLCKGCNI